MPAPSSLASLTADDFAPRVNDAFRISLPNGELALKLAELRRLGHAKRAGGAFSLLFTTPPGPFLPQAIYPLDHPALGRLDLFLVPLGPIAGENCYEAVFT